MNRLDTLPPEVLFNILSYTEPICNLNLTSYPLNALAATNKQLNAVVEEYARNLLKRHADIVPPRNARVFTCRRKWLAEICYFCKKPSKRKACLYKTLVCCFKCDKAEFPKMVHFQFPSSTCPVDDNANNTSSQTMTQAIQETHLSKLDLFTPSPLHPTLPPLPTGLYHCMGGTATMLSTPHVQARKTYIHTLLGSKATDESYLRPRPSAHERIIKHLNIEYFEGRGWWQAPDMEDEDSCEEDTGEGEGKKKAKGPYSMRSAESRRAYAEKGLKKEWLALGMEEHENFMGGVKRRRGRVGIGWKNKGGDSRESAIAID
ncbi:hypothetical protein GT037_005293 [Alternaria burnsii]|uniref:F-box domain-containing protein n=1 Tax=Alternaria burnsii TaxID=1187904 RepID=A0A8H7B662_9PLEO|nr:uncharacterized protein GT037_005293 [Alternaria burnsii]KAF7677081.1 hypothetical protein GT037_005293 [Alternaria burnsii]